MLLALFDKLGVAGTTSVTFSIGSKQCSLILLAVQCTYPLHPCHMTQTAFLPLPRQLLTGFLQDFDIKTKGKKKRPLWASYWILGRDDNMIHQNHNKCSLSAYLQLHVYLFFQMEILESNSTEVLKYFMIIHLNLF